MIFIRRHWFALLLFGAWLARLPQLVMPYWYDEGWTQWVSALPWPRMWAAVAGDVHPVGFFVLTWLIAQAAPWALRALPLAFSLLAVVLAREVARALDLPEPVQVIASLLMAFTPWALYFGAELRAYSMLECAVLLGWLCVFRRWWVGLALAFYAMIQLHNMGFVYAAIIGLYALWRERRGWWKPSLAGAGALLAYLPTSVLLQQLREVGGGYWIPRPGLADLLLTPYEFLFLGVHGTLMVPAMAFTVAMLLLVALRWKERPILVLAAGAPVGLVYLISFALPVYLNRPLIGAAPFWYMLVGQVLASWKSYRRVVATASAVPLLAVLAVSPARQDMVSRYQTAEVARIVRTEPKAPVWHMGLSLLVQLHQYRLPNPQYLAPGFDQISAGHYSVATMEAMGIVHRPVTITGPTWIVVPKDEGADAPAQIAGWCRTYHCEAVLDWSDPVEPMYGVEVWKVWP